MKSVEALIRNIPDFPKPGIQFKDITPILANPKGLSDTVDWFCKAIKEIGECDMIAGIESRGFIFGPAIAKQMNKAFVPIRKPGKLPYDTHKIEYELEYGIDALEIHTDAIKSGAKVALIDDLLATGGTAAAGCRLIQLCEAKVSSAIFLIELDFLKGRNKIEECNVYNIASMIHY